MTNQGVVWITATTADQRHCEPEAGRDDQILKFTQDGKFVLQIGHSNQSKGNADTVNVHRAADVQVNPRTKQLIVADGYGNHRVIVFDRRQPAGSADVGRVGNKPVDDDHCEGGDAERVPAGRRDRRTEHRARRCGVEGRDSSTSPTARTRRVQSFTPDGKF